MESSVKKKTDTVEKKKRKSTDESAKPKSEGSAKKSKLTESDKPTIKSPDDKTPKSKQKSAFSFFVKAYRSKVEEEMGEEAEVRFLPLIFDAI